MATKKKPLSKLNVVSMNRLEGTNKCICVMESVEDRGIQSQASYEIPYTFECEYTQLPFKAHDRVLSFNEYDFYQTYELFSKEQRYDFKVVSCQEFILYDYRIVVTDKYDRIQEFIWHRRFPKGRTLNCLVAGFKENNKGDKSLILDDPKLSAKETEDNFDEKNPPMYHGKWPEQWVGEVQGKPKHLYGSSFKCSCCHREFGPRQGYKLDLEDLIFCKHCGKVIFKRESKRQPHIILTAMGNKK